MNKAISEETAIALFTNDLGYIKKDIAEIKQSVKELAGVYPTKAEFATLAQRVVDLENGGKLWKALAPVIGAVVGSVITVLLLNYLNSFRPVV